MNKKHLALLIPVLAFTAWVVYIFFQSLNDGALWRVVFSSISLALLIVCSLILVLNGFKSRESAKGKH